MDLDQLRAFVTIAKEGNLTRAASSLFLSQPAISAKIKALESEIGLRLFDRTPKGMVLTHQGKMLHAEAIRTLEAAKGFISQAKEFSKGISGQIRLGTISEPIALRLGEFLSRMVVTCPNVAISITQGISGVVIERVLAGDLDAGYVIGRPNEPDLSTIELSPVKFLVVGPIAWQKDLLSADWKVLEQYPWIGTPRKCSFSTISNEMFHRLGIDPKRVAEADQENALKSLVARGLGLSILREDQALIAAAAGDIFILPQGHTESVFCFIQRKSSARDPVNIAIMDVLKEIWHDTKAPA